MDFTLGNLHIVLVNPARVFISCLHIMTGKLFQINIYQVLQLLPAPLRHGAVITFSVLAEYP
ncbi:hypothetical protein AUN02_00940 [Cronobacter sakazakii]|nr:hypothetical protein DC438_23540 [Cronobacter sakazakii]EGT4352471.1 hypothetical protein [Cronobacter sakazakii]MCI0197434.1 hypothetical protein [Cronobacter sakazakii]NCH44462.1 hypothetical protein [Cronobacter sakazakii]PQY22126.1 hypothetical protein C5964_01010 [Cronobacter sakazakii]